ncbi:hypothetical protein CFAM422_013263 [Trichoderma lentiforme]|uniref:Uncharacterized protein n=1 Tax=Trichoderma lentiforme TaxID=1567552 RepID=A0A9P5C6X1_9HYPO|nr:hypothetical protein CFAM422_013263 [Trichoderma lentiforme]
MQVKILAGFFLLIASVLAGGYAGALERVWLFYAYQIDGLNDKSLQTLGYRCLKWDHAQKKCVKKGKNDLWKACEGKIGPDKRCSMTALLNHLGRVGPNDQLVADSAGKPLPLDTADPDPQKTAENLYKHYSDPAFKYPGVKDYEPYRVLKDGTEDYVSAIEKISDVVAKTSVEVRLKAALAGKPLEDATKKLFSRFEETNRLIKTARIGDHGPYLIAAAENYLKPHGIDVQIEILDPPVNPVDGTKNWKTVDWEKTIDMAVEAGKGTREQMEKLMDDAKKDFYDAPVDGRTETEQEKKAREKALKHRTVITAFTNAHNKAVGCI